MQARRSRLRLTALIGVVVLVLEVGTATPSAGSITSKNYVGWGEVGVDPGHLYGPRGIAVGPYGDLVYVADTGNNRIEAFTPAGIFLYKWGHYGKGKGDFDHPVAVTTDPGGNVYVADNGNGLVQKFTEKGAFALQWTVPGVIGVAADSKGHVYAVSSFLNLVSRRTTAGVTEGSWQAFKPSESDGFVENAAKSIAVDGAGNVYVGDNVTVHWRACHDGWPAPAEHRTEVGKFTPDGGKLGTARTDSAPGPKCSSMAETYHTEYLDGVAVNPADGWLYTAKPGHDDIVRIPPSLDDRFGDVVLGPRHPETTFGVPSLNGLAFDCRGNLYVVSRVDHVVVKYLNSGAAPVPCGERPKPILVTIGDSRIDGRGLVVEIGCQAARCKGTATVKPTGPCQGCPPFQVGSRRFDIPGGVAGHVRFPIDKSDSGAVKKKKQLPVLVIVVVGGKTVTKNDSLKSRSVLTIDCSKVGTVGKALSVSGFLGPPHPGTTIDVFVDPPAGAPLLLKPKTGATGKYMTSFIPKVAGAWNAYAQWPGDADHEAAGAGPCLMTVTGPAPSEPPPPNAPTPPGGDSQPPPTTTTTQTTTTAPTTTAPPPLPDLVISELKKNRFTVRNTGGGPAGPFDVKVKNPQIGTVSFHFDGLAAGDSASGNFQCSQGEVTVKADSGNDVTESNEDNNSDSLIVQFCQ